MNETNFSSDFVRRVFIERAMTYRLTAFLLKIDLPCNPDFLDEVMRDCTVILAKGKDVANHAADLCSFDTPPLLEEEAEALCQSFMNYMVFDAKTQLAYIVEYHMYGNPEADNAPDHVKSSRLFHEEQRGIDIPQAKIEEASKEFAQWRQWKEDHKPKHKIFHSELVEVEVYPENPFHEEYLFTREGLVFDEDSLYSSYCFNYEEYFNGDNTYDKDTGKYLDVTDRSFLFGLTKIPPMMDGRFAETVFYEPTTEWGELCLARFKECLGCVLDNRSEQLKNALAPDEDMKKKTMRRCYEEKQKGKLTHKEIGILVAKEMGEEIPYSEGTVRNYIEKHWETCCPTEPPKKSRRGRPPNKKDA